jgi:murein DD-endopeptidase MepM/ murein hydrolase activator NlpD
VRRDALVGLLSGGFLLAVIATVLLIVVATPEYGEPGRASSDGAAAAVLDVASPAASEAPEAVEAALPSPTSALPDRLKGYRWPVRGGMVADYYDWDADGRFVIDGQPVHGGLVITWFDGAIVKAAHSGDVVAAGRDWQDEVGYDDELDDYYARLKRRKQKSSQGVVIDDGNGYRSVYSELKDLRVKPGERVKAGTIIGTMAAAEKRWMVRYELVRMDGDWLKVAANARKLGFPDYVREHVDPLVVLRLEANKKPRTDKPRPPSDPPRLSRY